MKRVILWLDNQRWKYPIIGIFISFITSFMSAFTMMFPMNAITITMLVWFGIATIGALIVAAVEAIDEDVCKKRQQLLKERGMYR